MRQNPFKLKFKFQNVQIKIQNKISLQQTILINLYSTRIDIRHSSWSGVQRSPSSTLCHIMMVISSLRGHVNCRSSHQKCLVKKGVLRNFKIHRKTPVLESLFDKVAGLRPLDSGTGVFL